jgi:hypothetical protein
MKTQIKIIAQEIDVDTNRIISEHTVYEKIAEAPKKINDLGFSHKEQIEILSQSQEAIVQAQTTAINDKNNICPHCNKKTMKKGKFKSDFHAVFTDHKVTMQRTQCTCGWQSKISVDGTYDSALHPDLVEMQSLFGAENSFQKTELFLAKKCCQNRPINNSSRIRKTISKVGRLLSIVKNNTSWGEVNDVNHPKELILTIDGGHIQSNNINKRTFEAITASIYDPKNLVQKDKHHSTITDKTVVASAKNDRQIQIKNLVMNACKKQGMSAKTDLVVLCDGAKNCWSVINSIENQCASITKILNWFHIGKKFKNTQSAIPDELKEEFAKAKWCLWHGNFEKSLKKLSGLKNKIDSGKKKLGTLITYLKNNQAHLVNYQEREGKGFVFTSQLAESTVNNLINERQKNDKRMQWSRDGADTILQIRSSVQSKDWKADWSSVQNLLYKEAV